MAFDWFWKAGVGAILLVVIPFVTSVLYQKANFSPVATSAWFFITTGVGIAGYLMVTGNSAALLGSERISIVDGVEISPVVIVVIAGVTTGVLGNILLFQSFGSSPNPGLPMAIVSGNALIAIIATRYLHKVAPYTFEAIEFNPAHGVGGVLIVGGVVVLRLWG